MRNSLIQTLIAVGLMLLISACSGPPTPKKVAGTYRGVLYSEGGELAFPLHVQAQQDSLSGFIVNGSDTVSFNKVYIKGDSLILGFDYYDSFLRAEVHSGSLTGKWKRRAEGGKHNVMKFTAEKGVTYRYKSIKVQTYPFDGDWQVTFTDEDGTFPAHGSFISQPDGKLYGTFQTETGDYRFLDGIYTDSTFTLSTFDGPHAYLFKGHLQPDGIIKGDFWSRDNYHATWTAKPGKNRLRDPMKTAANKSLGNKVSFSFPNVDGDTISTADTRFTNKPMLVYLFGSWCPNCADEAQMLKKIYTEDFSDTDLQIVGLAFEYTGDYDKDMTMVRRYKQRFDIPWTLLLAGSNDKQQAEAKLPFLNKILSFPTSIFISKDHTIKAIHVGFNGPATGSAYFNEIQRFKDHINEILH